MALSDPKSTVPRAGTRALAPAHKNGHSHQRTYSSSGKRRYSKNYIQSHSAATNIADVKGQPPGNNQQHYKISHSRQNIIGYILTVFFSYRNDPPDIELGAYIDKDGNQYHKAKTCGQLFRKYSCLG